MNSENSKLTQSHEYSGAIKGQLNRAFGKSITNFNTAKTDDLQSLDGFSSPCAKLVDPTLIQGILHTLDSDQGSDSKTPLPQKFHKMSSDSSSGSSSEAESEIISKLAPSPRGSPKKMTPVINRQATNHDVSSSSSSESDSEDTPPVTRQSPSKRRDDSLSKRHIMSDSSSDSDVPTTRRREPSYKPPVNYGQIEYSKGQALWMEDIKPHEELWLMTVPANFNTNDLMQKPAMFDGSISIKTERDDTDEDIKYCWEVNARPDKSQSNMVVLLPSKKDKILHQAKNITGQMSVTKSLQLMPYSIDDTPTPRGAEIPEGLVMRNIPFGSGAPDKTLNGCSQSEDEVDNKKDKKKKKKSKRSLEDPTNSDSSSKKKKKHKKHKKHSS